MTSTILVTLRQCTPSEGVFPTTVLQGVIVKIVNTGLINFLRPNLIIVACGRRMHTVWV